jgi:excisionase family DNA binding protein
MTEDGLPYGSDMPPAQQASGHPHADQRSLMTTAEVADHFQVTTRTIRNWCDSGMLKRILVGRKVYFRRSDIETLTMGDAVEERQ